MDKSFPYIYTVGTNCRKLLVTMEVLLRIWELDLKYVMYPTDGKVEVVRDVQGTCVRTRTPD